MTKAEMTEGYLDGLDGDNPDPGPNRSPSYKHGFANGRDDLRGKARAPAHVLRQQAKQILEQAHD